MLIDSATLKDGAAIEADLCIVGSGAGGLSIAAEFRGSDVTVAIAESGGRTYQERAQALNKVECTALGIKPRSRIRQYGGSTTAWSGKWLPLTGFDVKSKDWIPHSGWPIAYEDLAEYYRRASAMHGGPSLDDYLQARHEPGDTGGERLEHFAPVSVYWLGPTNLDFSLKAGRFIGHSSNIDVYTSLTVTNVVLTESLDAVDCLEAVTGGGHQVRMKARHFILAGGGIENARLLLASNGQVETGIGNRSGNVGRFYMDHPGGNVASVEIMNGHRFPECFGLSLKGNGTHRLDLGFRLRDHVVEENRSVNSYFVWRPQGEHEPSPSLRKLFASLMLLKSRPTHWKTYPDLMRSLLALDKKNFVQVLRFRLSTKVFRKGRRQRFKLNFHIEQIPSPDNRVTLSRERDEHGQPLAALHWTLAETEIRSIKLLHDKLADLLSRTQCGTLIWNDGAPSEFRSLTVKDSSHHMGTTRMGIDEKTSVVDSDCRVHGIGNLYVAGSSVFPTSGFANPTFTIAALAIRLADHIKGKLA